MALTARINRHAPESKQARPTVVEDQRAHDVTVQKGYKPPGCSDAGRNRLGRLRESLGRRIDGWTRGEGLVNYICNAGRMSWSGLDDVKGRHWSAATFSAVVSRTSMTRSAFSNIEKCPTRSSSTSVASGIFFAMYRLWLIGVR